MTTLPRWLRPRFSLRTLFVVVTASAVGAAWLGGEMRFVRERKNFCDHLWAHGGSLEYTSQELPVIPWWRDWLGDFPVERIRVPYTCESEFRSEAQRLFPEASFWPISKEEMEKDEKDRLNQQREEEEKRRKGGWSHKH